MKIYYIIYRKHISDPIATLEEAKRIANQCYNYGYVIVSIAAGLEFDKQRPAPNNNVAGLKQL